MRPLLLFLALCTISAHPKDPAAPDLDQVDALKLDQARVVLRVRKVPPKIPEAGKFHWDTVEILHVYKNVGGKNILGRSLNVAHYGWRPGVPDGVSTIYLEPFGEVKDGRWRLLGGDGAKGSSHATAK